MAALEMAPDRPSTNRHRLAMFCAWFFMVFLVLLPKGGFKLGGLPITWGYLFYGVTAIPLIVIRLLATPLRFKKTLLVAVALQVPFLILFLYAGFTYGNATAVIYSNITNLFILPALYLLVYPPFLQLIDGERLVKYFRWCIFLAAVWGIFNFFWHPFTGHFIEIPYLTVNIADYGTLEYTKHIARGRYLKLISTYNNGNLYGVCTLMLLPLYNLFEKKLWRRNVLRVALLLSLSRGVWVGLVLEQFLTVAVLLSKQVRSFPRLHLGRATKQVVALLATVGFIFIGLIFNNSTLAFLFDPTGGGRVAKLSGLSNATFLPSVPLWAFDEILYASAAQYWGYSGLITFSLVMFSPLILLFVDSSALQSPTRRAALKGLILYMLMAAIDGGYNYIPTMSFYWFIYMIYIFGWPASHGKMTNAERSSPAFSLDATPGLAKA